MRFQEEELMFLTTVIKGPAPFGVFLKFPPGKSGEEVGEEAVELLQKKGILGEDRTFTKKGGLIALYWESYCSCTRHLILNQSFIAVLPNRRLIVINKIGKEYEMQTIDAAAYMKVLLDNSEFMCQEDKKNERTRSKSIPYEEWRKERVKKESPCLIIGGYEEQKMKREVAYYWEEKRGYVYDLNKEKEREIYPRKMRMDLLIYLGMEKEIAMYGGR